MYKNGQKWTKMDKWTKIDKSEYLKKNKIIIFLKKENNIIIF